MATETAAVVLFLFAKEKLLFRYPFDDTFAVDVAQPTQQLQQYQQSQSSMAAHPPAQVRGRSSGSHPFASSGVSSTSTSTHADAAASTSHADTATPGDGAANAARGTHQAAVGIRSKKQRQPIDDTTRVTSQMVPHTSMNEQANSTPVTGVAPQRILRRPTSTFCVANMANAGDGASKTPVATVAPANQSEGPSTRHSTAGATTTSSSTVSHHTSSNPVGGDGRSHLVAGSDGKGVIASTGGGHTVATCVGIPPNTLLHLLRVPLPACTTISIANGTFLVFPLTPAHDHPNGPTRSRSSEQTKVHRGQDDTQRRGNARWGSTQQMDGTHQRSEAASIVLVVAMNQPDTNDGAIARFTQCFINVLLREEHRARYVSTQIELMESLLDALNLGEGAGVSSSAIGAAGLDAKHSWSRSHDSDLFEHDGRHQSGQNRVVSPSASEDGKGTPPMSSSVTLTPQRIQHGRGHTPLAGNISAAGPSTARAIPANRTQTVFAALMQDTRATLCAEVAQVSQCMNTWLAATRGPGGHIGGQVNSAQTRHPFSESIDGCSCGTQALPSGIHINGLLYLPLSHLTGEMKHKPHLAAIHTRQGPLSLVTLEDRSFPEHLQSAYLDLVGGHYAQLLPLTKVFDCLVSLTPPWCMGSFHRSLELALLDGEQRRQPLSSTHSREPHTSDASGEVHMAEHAASVPSSGPGRHLTSEDGNDELSGTPPPSGQGAVRPAVGDLPVAVVSEFLCLHGAIQLGGEVEVCFSHGEVLPVDDVARQHRRLAKKTARQTSPQPTTVGGVERNSGYKDKQHRRHTKHARWPTAPASLVLHLLRRMREAPEPHRGKTSAYHIPSLDAQASRQSQVPNRTPTPSSTATETAHSGSNVPPLGSHRVQNASGVQTWLSSNAAPSADSSSTRDSRAPLPGATATSSAAAGNRIPTEQPYVVHCIWGSACPLCEELALDCASSARPHIPLAFPCLDPLVMAHVRRTVSLQAARSSQSHAASRQPLMRSEAGGTLAREERPWFVRPDMFMAPITTHGGSSLQVFNSLTGHTSVDDERTVFPTSCVHRDGTAGLPLDSPVSLTDEQPRSSVADVGMPRGKGKFRGGTSGLKSRQAIAWSKYCKVDDYEGSGLLYAESVPNGAAGWLSRSAELIEDRLRWSQELCAALLTASEHTELAAGRGASATAQDTGVGSATDPSSPHSTTVPSNVRKIAEEETASSMQPLPLSTHSPPPVRKFSSTPPILASKRYTKRRLPDRTPFSPPSDTVALRQLGAPTTGEASSWVTQSDMVSIPSPESATDPSPQSTGPKGECTRIGITLAPPLRSLPLMGREVPVECILQFMLHHLVAMMWGKPGIGVDLLLRQLERNLRRLPPFLAHLPYILQLCGAGLTSKRVLSMLQNGAEKNVRGASLSVAASAPSDAATAEQDISLSHSMLVATETVSQCSMATTHAPTSMAGRTDSSRPPPLALSGQHAEIFQSCIPTALDAQLLQAYEVFQRLSLMPCLSRYAGHVVRPVPARLLLHALVNEFCDVLIISGSNAGRGARTQECHAMAL